MPRQIVLVRFDLVPANDDDLPQGWSAALAAEGFSAQDFAIHRELDGLRACGYLYPAPEVRSIDDLVVDGLRRRLSQCQPQVVVARLRALMEIDGASTGRPASHHYVVETDVAAHADADLNAWYDREHMPGLAAVPGTVRAARFRNLDGGPTYHACYSLETRETFGSQPWLQVRATDWSSRVRPHFMNTRRTMFRSLSHRFGGDRPDPG